MLEDREKVIKTTTKHLPGNSRNFQGTFREHENKPPSQFRTAFMFKMLHPSQSVNVGCLTDYTQEVSLTLCAGVWDSRRSNTHTHTEVLVWIYSSSLLVQTVLFLPDCWEKDGWIKTEGLREDDVSEREKEQRVEKFTDDPAVCEHIMSIRSVCDFVLMKQHEGCSRLIPAFLKSFTNRATQSGAERLWRDVSA